MKKQFSALMCLFISLLTSCQNNNAEQLNIIAPVGAPSIAFYNYSDSEYFTTNSDPSNIVSFMTESSKYDVVVIDTVSGISAIHNGAPYKIAATITFGNFYLASTGNDENKTLDENDTIVLFGEGKTPDKIFHYIYGNQYDNNIEYVSAVSDAASCLVKGKNLITSNTVDYVFVAEPALSAALSNTNAPTYGKSSIYADMQQLYKEKSGQSEMVQASIFIKDGTDKNDADAFLNSLKKDINTAIATPDVIAEGIGKISEEEANTLYGVKASTVTSILKDSNRLGLGYKNAFENKDAIDLFIGLFGKEKTNEEIYYK